MTIYTCTAFFSFFLGALAAKSKMIFRSPGHKMIYLFFLDQTQMLYSFASIACPSFHETLGDLLEIQQSTDYLQQERKKSTKTAVLNVLGGLQLQGCNLV